MSRPTNGFNEHDAPLRNRVGYTAQSDRFHAVGDIPNQETGAGQSAYGIMRGTVQKNQPGLTTSEW